MTIYCDESGGLSAGAMTFAAVAITPETAQALHDHFRTITGLRGELKGSRINLAERALLIEIFARMGGRAWVAVADLPALRRNSPPQHIDDLAVYTALLRRVIAQWQADGDPVAIRVMIDEGRYDPAKLAVVRQTIQQTLGAGGEAMLGDSKRCEGIQIADVIANCYYNIAAKSPRADRIATILAPFAERGTIRTLRVDHLG